MGIEKIKAGIALLPKLKNDLRCLVTNDALPVQTQPIATIIAALEACKPLIEGGGVDRNAVLEEAASFIDGFDTNFTRQNFGEPYVRKTEIVASVRALKDASPLPALVKEGVVDGWNTNAGELAKAVKEFETALPGFWWSVGQCSVGAHASCAVDGNGVQWKLLKDIEAGHPFDAGFHCDTIKGSPAQALHDVMEQALAALPAPAPASVQEQKT